jgi:hypothetical protein
MAPFLRTAAGLAALLALHAAAQQYDPGPKATPPAGVVVPAEQKAVVPSLPSQENRTIDVNSPPPVPAKPPEPRPSPADVPGPGVSVAPSPAVTGSPRAALSKKKAPAKAPKKTKKKAVERTTGPDGKVVLSNDR